MAKKRIAKKEIKPIVNQRIEKSRKREIPLGVKIISILGYIFSALILACGILLIIAGIILLFVHVDISKMQLPPDFPPQFAASLNDVIAPLLLIVGIIFIVIAFLGYFINRGLWKLRNWARVVVIVLSILGAISAIASILRGRIGQILNLAINVIIAVYLIVSEDVKRAFS